jgi:peptide chain release factor 2
LEGQKQKLKEFEEKAQEKDFWRDQKKAAEVNQEISRLKEDIEIFEEIENEIEELEELVKISEGDDSLTEEIIQKQEELEKKLEKEKVKIFLAGKYDRSNAILEIFAGAGGVDAQDWATMLLRMFQRYCLSKGFQVKIIHQSFGEAGGPEGRIGTKSATLEIKGKYAYGFLKKEAGVHRLVRQSPFSAKKLRHTSFALVEVLPEIKAGQGEEIKIKPEDLKIDVFRASGPGGQYVNRRESAVRITHLPTGITVSSQSERLQGLNKEKAMEVLWAKLYRLKEQERRAELKKIKGESVPASWGNQIRSYVLYPYKLIKDLRTGVETSDVEKVLDGGLEEFISAEVMLKQRV